MNKGTRIRTALRILVSFYSALCVYQVAINELAEMLDAKWIAVVCAILIVLLGIVVDTVTTWYNNDFTEEGCIGTNLTRQLKIQREAMEYENQFLSEAMNAEEEDDPQAVEGE